jgi:hypothetical protein
MLWRMEVFTWWLLAIASPLQKQMSYGMSGCKWRRAEGSELRNKRQKSFDHKSRDEVDNYLGESVINLHLNEALPFDSDTSELGVN